MRNVLPCTCLRWLNLCVWAGKATISMQTELHWSDGGDESEEHSPCVGIAIVYFCTEMENH